MKKKINSVSKTIALTGVVSALSMVSNTTTSDADSSLEQEFLSVIDDRNSDEFVVENGIFLRKGEAIDLILDEGWELSNNKGVVQIDSDGILHPLKEGTVYISNEIDDKLHVIEVYVSEDEEPVMFANARASSTVNRNYYKVFIDPGHGGSDPGAVGNGNEEADLNLQISKRVETKLKAKGIEVKMSRTTDVFYSLSERAKMANNYGADVFVSIHQNSATSASANGIETFYHTNKVAHKPLSQEIQDKAISSTGATNRGVKSANLGVLKSSTMPSALFEGGFISNPTESAKLATPEYQEKLANAIANGIEAYLKATINLKGNNNGNNSSNGSNDSSSNTTLPVIKTGTVTSNSDLNVRSGAGTSYTKLGSLKNGSKVEIVGEENGWYKIKYGSGYGFVSSSYIKCDSNTTTTPSVLFSGEVTTNDLNVRTGPSTSFNSIGKLNKGAKVDVVGEESGWYKIKYGSGYGYVSKSYVNKVSNSTTTPPTNSNTTPPTNNVTVINTGVVINTDSLNVRSGYGTSYSKIGSLGRNAKVEIVETKNGWHKIKYGSGYGYVSGDYIKINTTTPTNNVTVINTGVVINTDSLNVRSGYGTSYSKIGSLGRNAKVEIVETKNGWHKIKYGSGYGYVSGDYIKINTTTPSNPNPNPTPPSVTVINKGTVTSNSALNVRSGAGTSYSKLGSLAKGSTVEIVETKNGWHKIKYGNGYGYVSAEYIKITTSSSSSSNSSNSSSTAVKTGTVYNASSGLNVRKGAGTSYASLGKLSNGTKVEIVSTSNGWHKIKYGSGYGYVSASYIK